ncbi:MAG: SUMF1/EgtB/PvdO family nonheme iron enzyme [Bryobacteraceae bacterium]|nr:SUMF1/EgtB/PvdO family nonheme iron enzyme [Bryobacteraceae bacterium]
MSDRQPLLQSLAKARLACDETFRLVDPQFLYERPIAERHRIVFYVGHVDSFDWNLLQSRFSLSDINPSLDKLFAFGIDPVDGQLPSDTARDWPSLEDIAHYTQRLRGELDRALVTAGDGAELDALLHVAIEHRWMHVETLSYMLHQLPIDRKIAPVLRRQDTAYGRPGHETTSMIGVPRGPATLGAARDGSFGWDNEFDAHTVDVREFFVDKCKVTNVQFAEFVRQGGYNDRALWTPEGWDWKERHGLTHPAFWKPDVSGFRLKGMFEDLAFAGDWPVYVSHAEATAYARWAGKRLLTEAEWHRAAYGTSSEQRQYPWGDAVPAAQHGYFDVATFEPHPVDAFPDGQSFWGVHGLIGNGWEWTASQFAPFSGFEAFPFYKGYSADFFDGMHYVMKGGSPRTERGMLRRSFRNWFQPHYQYAYAGFRCGKDA